jgi:hypothetical protein
MEYSSEVLAHIILDYNERLAVCHYVCSVAVFLLLLLLLLLLLPPPPPPPFLLCQRGCSSVIVVCSHRGPGGCGAGAALFWCVQILQFFGL